MPGLYRTVAEKKELEARNGALQFLLVLHRISEWIPGVTRVDAKLLLDLQYRAIVNIYSCAGSFRKDFVEIRDGDIVVHRGVPHETIDREVCEMCAYVNNNWDTATTLHLASYALWKLNWIHPFFGGNGRTSRAFSYLILCAKIGMRLPGTITIPDGIVRRRSEYITALRRADSAWSEGRIDLTLMDKMLEAAMADQLLSTIEQAKGQEITEGR